MGEKKQIEEMAKVLCGMASDCNKCMFNKVNCYEHNEAESLYNAGYRKQSRGEWKQAYNSFPRYVCTNCNHLFNNKTFKYCPNCGAKMKGGAK
jgi:outer membrane protein assembly factor BamD (BamD/ComL family)